MKDNIKEFLNDTSNFNNIKHRSEADLQFELGYFLKSKIYYYCPQLRL